MRHPIADVYTVDGGAIRTTKDVDFIGGGHHAVYPWIPPGQAWVEAALGRDGRFIAVHELVEIAEMRTRGWGYERAHARANEIEALARRGKALAPILARVVRGWPRR